MAPLHRSSALPLLALTCLACVASCGPAAPEAELIAPGEPGVTLGYYHDDDYQPLTTVAEAPVSWGLQGGTWTMPSVRIRGIASPALIWGTVTLEDGSGPGEVLGHTEREHGFAPAADGSLESRAIALPIQHAPPRQFDSISDLYGQTARLEVMASDAQGRGASSSVLVKLVED
jgi:hypothetical protein